jgi:hypothetical protein
VREKIWRGIDHAEHLDDTPHAVERAEVRPQRREDGEAGLARGGATLHEIKVRADAPGDHRTVCAERAVARHVGQTLHDYDGPVNGDWLRCERQRELQASESRFVGHGGQGKF